MDDQWLISTLIRNQEIAARLKDFWNSDLQMFIRDDEEKKLYFGLIPQIFNIKVVIGKLALKDLCYDDGY